MDEPPRPPGGSDDTASAQSADLSRTAARRGTVVALEVGAAVLILAFVGLALTGELDRLSTEHLRLAPGWLALSVVGFAALQLAHAELWRLQLHTIGGDIPGPRSRAIWCISAVARYVPTSMLMPTLRVAMAQRVGILKRLTVASLVYEAALALVGALVVSAYFIIELPRLEGVESRWLILVLPVLALAMLHPRVFGPLTAWGLRRAGRDPLPLALSEARLAGVALLYAATFLLAGMSLYALARGLYPLPLDALPNVLGAFAIGFSASVLAFVLPAGLGARELALVAALSPVMPSSVAVAVAVGSRVVQIAIEIVFAAVTPVLARRAAGR